MTNVAEPLNRRPMDAAECRRLLETAGWAVMSAAEMDNGTPQPYSVPMAYALGDNGRIIYLTFGPGRKQRALAKNPRLCLTMADVQGLDRWRSVVVTGEARWLVRPEEREPALTAFSAQTVAGTRTTDTPYAASLAEAFLVEVKVEAISGCAVGDAEWRSTGAPTAVEAMTSLRRLVHILRATNLSVERSVGITVAQLFALRQIANHPGQSMGEIAGRTATAQSSVSEVVGRLIKRGFVDRTVDQEDHRRTHLQITAAGLRALDEAPDTIQERLVGAFLALSPERRQAVAEGLELWVAAAGLERVPAPMFFENGGNTEE